MIASIFTTSSGILSSISGTIKKRFKSSSEPFQGLGTFNGVYVPSVLSIFGVILYMRLSWLLGELGLPLTLLMVFLACSITLITSLSIAASATNIHVKGGGVYYMISRSFGIEIGSSIGIPLYLAQALGIAFYIIGFVESLKPFFPFMDTVQIGLYTLFAVTLLAYYSSSFAMKIQIGIFCVIISSLISLFIGSYEPTSTVNILESSSSLPFWTAFAIFFPAVTGIESGVSMSGDLKSPKKSLPLGTIAAVLTGLAVYTLLPIFLYWKVPSEDLLNNPNVLQNIAISKSLIILGIWGATLSSAIGALLAAPRTLQALSLDSIVPKFIAKEFGSSKEPRIATLLTFVIACAGLFVGSIDVMAPILTMFFLISYTFLNLAAGIEEMLSNPSWRPTFRVSWPISFLGSALCIFVMFMINPGATFVALFLVIAIYLLIRKRKLSKNWDDIRQGVMMYFARSAIYNLSLEPMSTRSWRPIFLVFTGLPSKRPHLLEFASSITQGKGFLTINSVIPSEFKNDEILERSRRSIVDFLYSNNIQSFVDLTVSDTVLGGICSQIDRYSFGPLTPNTIVIGDSNKFDQYESYIEIIKECKRKQKNLIVLREDNPEQLDLSNKKEFKSYFETKQTGSIDIWWDDEDKDNSNLMILIAHMLNCSPHWRKTDIHVKSLVTNESARKSRIDYFSEFFEKNRLKIHVDVYVCQNIAEDFFTMVQNFSASSPLVCIGMRYPNEDESDHAYFTYYKKQIRSLKNIQTIAFVASSEKLDLAELFSEDA